MKKFGRFEEIVFVILFEDAEFFWLIQGTEMDGRGIDGGGDIHEFEAESAVGKREIADVANESNIGIVDGDVQLGLIVEASGVIRSRRTC